MPDAIRWLAERLGLNRQHEDKTKLTKEVDIITTVCRDKRMPVESFTRFGVKDAKRGREKFRVARVNVYSEVGIVHSYFDLWPGSKGKFKCGKGNAGMFFPGQLPVAGQTWLLVEGVKDAAALVGLGFHAAGMPTNKLANKYARLFSGVDIIIVPDLDLSGVRGANYTASNLSGIATSVAVARLPGQVKEKQGDDVRDVLRLSNGEDLVREAVDAATKWEPCGDDDRVEAQPEVIVTMDEAAVAAQVVLHLGKLGWDSPWIKQRYRDGVRVFVRGGLLVHAIESDDLGSDGRLAIRALPSCLVRERITQSCRLLIEKEVEDDIEVKPVRPSGWLIEAVLRRGHYGGAIRPLSGIIESPTIRVDGSILQAPGYDLRTGLIYRPTVEFPVVPHLPTQIDAAKALSDLHEVLAEFPMLDGADRSAWVAMVLSMIGRSCIDGCVPLFAITANIRGAGKSLLVDSATLIAYGHRAGRHAFTRDDNEMRKVITAVALAATPSVLFDNLDVQLGGAALDAAITSLVWSGRVLGQSQMTGDLPMRTVWSATGNNLAFGSDIGRRGLPIRLQSSLEHPEDRSGFRHPDLLGWIESERPRLAVAALTILRAYFVAGCPIQSGGDWGSFENFSAVIRGAIIWAGGQNPLATRETALACDDTTGLLGKLIVGIEQADSSGEGLTTKEIERMTFGRDVDSPSHDALFEAVAEICGDRFNGRTFGRRVRGLSGRVWQGQFIESKPAGGGVKRWRVRNVESGFDGFSGTGLSSSDTKTKCEQGELSGLDRDDLEAKSVPQRVNPSNQPESQPANDWGEL
ncbi:toprim domain-containing protein [Symmachiella macrocystis]|nr:toprim domain-containing protein [Symmachiella macrocystis]